MSRSDLDRLYDIADAIAALRSHVARGALGEAVVFDAVRMRLLEIGEAVKGLSEELTAREPAIPWRTIARSRDNLVHHYFATEVQIIEDTIKTDLAPLDEAVARLIAAAERPSG